MCDSDPDLEYQQEWEERSEEAAWRHERRCARGIKRPHVVPGVSFRRQVLDALDPFVGFNGC